MWWSEGLRNGGKKIYVETARDVNSMEQRIAEFVVTNEKILEIVVMFDELVGISNEELATMAK